MKYWALANWESWFTTVELADTLAMAKDIIERAGDAHWRMVKGPDTTVVATLKRLVWTWQSPLDVTDDIGGQWNFALDPPCTFVTAVRASVRRCRFQRIGSFFPHLIPTSPDVYTTCDAPRLLSRCSASCPHGQGQGQPEETFD